MTKRRKQILFITQFSLLLGIEAITCFTVLGSLPITPAIVATLAMVPVIITSILLNTWAGTLMGLIAGVFSLIVWTFMPPGPAAFVFTPAVEPGNFFSLIIVLVPRALVGTFSGLLYHGLIKLFKNVKTQFVQKYRYHISIISSAAVGSLTNTILVMTLIYFCFGAEYAAAYGIAFEALIGAILMVIATNGVAELVTSVILALAICLPIGKFITNTMEE